MDTIRVVPTTDAHIEGFQRCVDAVARERHWLGFVEGPSLAQARTFIEMLIAGAGVQFVALDEGGEVVGWCDVVRDHREGFRHAWRLGMGLLPVVRGRGVGRRLAEAAIAAARAKGAERIELEVFASNTRAIALYERLGFAREGVKRRARKLDGGYDDDVLMALLFA
jgi:RimJ/RimL family protein N-acetyltransferase